MTDPDPATYADLLTAALRPELEWSERDIQQIIEHFLTVPVAVQFPDLAADVGPTMTLGNALAAATPIPEVLTAISQFAKANRDGPQRDIPLPAATAIYFGVLAAIRVAGQSTTSQTSLSETELATGLQWLASYPLAPALLRQLATAANHTRS